MKYFDYEYRVIYGDTDKMGITYYVNYLRWFEAARNEYFRALGMPYTECEKKGIFLPVVEVSARYAASCTYDDVVIVRTSVSQFGRSTMTFQYLVMLKSSGKQLVSGSTTHVFIDSANKPVRVPEDVRKSVSLFSLLEPQN